MYKGSLSRRCRSGSWTFQRRARIIRLPKLIQQLAQAATSGPKTVLGFCALALGIIVTGSVAGIAVLARYTELHHHIGQILVVDLVFSACLIGAVLLIALLDPMKLMLGQVGGDEYIAHRRLTLGDSTSGERVANVVVALEPNARADEFPQTSEDSAA